MNILPETRRKKLKELMSERRALRGIETVNGLEALIIENTKILSEKNHTLEYDFLWFSGLCNAAFRGKPDTEYISAAEKTRDLDDIFAVSRKPVIADLDTGGNIEHLYLNIQMLERIGVSGAVIEDKTGIKRNSLYETDGIHRMENTEEFSEKIAAARKAASCEEFMIFARTESLIAGESIDTALERAEAYIKSGADGIVIHSRRNDGMDVFEFTLRFRRLFPDTPLVFIPTAYNSFTFEELTDKGADIVIYANHLMRSACLAMKKTAESVLINGSTGYADLNYCSPVSEVLGMIDKGRE